MYGGATTVAPTDEVTSAEGLTRATSIEGEQRRCDPRCDWRTRLVVVSGDVALMCSTVFSELDGAGELVTTICRWDGS